MKIGLFQLDIHPKMNASLTITTTYKNYTGNRGSCKSQNRKNLFLQYCDYNSAIFNSQKC